MKKLDMKGIAVLIYILMLAYWIFLQFNPDKSSFYNYGFNFFVALLYIGVGIMSFYFSHIVHEKKPIFNFFLSIAISAGAWGIAGLIWSYYNLVLHVASPYPSAADIFFVIYTFFIGYSIWQLLEILKFHPKKSHMYLTVLIVMAVSFTVFMINKPEYNANLTALAIIFNSAYPLLDTFLLAIALIVFITNTPLNKGLGLIVLSIFFQGAGDLLFSFFQSKSTYWNGDIADLFYLLSIFCLTFGVSYFFENYKRKQTMI